MFSLELEILYKVKPYTDVNYRTMLPSTIIYSTLESKSGGFTFHEKTPTISASQINPVQDNNLLLELALVSSVEMCPKFSVSYIHTLSVWQAVYVFLFFSLCGSLADMLLVWGGH